MRERLFLGMVALLPLHTVYLSAWISWKPFLILLAVLAIWDLIDGLRERAWPWQGRVSLAFGVFMATVAIAACKFQDDPHNQKISHSTFEEYEHNTTHLRDRLLLATVRQLAGWPKMPGERDCYARFEREWIRN